ncbi:MAG: sodium/proline symporter [Clostridiales bacterium]|nr:sodium/proline symporter [Clostridiales bacterium]
MTSDQVLYILAMACYMAVILGLSVYVSKRANSSSSEYFIGGRKLGPWVAAMSAEASDMSGWLLMGLPGVAYWCGLSDAAWTAIGLAIGTYINFYAVSKRLRRYSSIAGNAITIPDFFSNRFKEKSPIILLISSFFILVFFSVYVGSCFVTAGKLFSTIFNADYHLMLIVGGAFVIAYTFLGGFLAESLSDFIQGLIMITAIVCVMIIGLASAGGIGNVLDNIKGIPGFLDFFGIASPTVESGVQKVVDGVPQFGSAGSYGFLTIISTLSWGLGYFGMPQVLLRFVAIRKVSELDRARKIATVWCVISLFAAVVIGLIGRALYPTALLTSSQAENVFIHLATTLFHPILAGLAMSGILAASMSSADSYLLIAASAVSKNIYQRTYKKDATDKQIMRVSRWTLLAIAVFGLVIAWDVNSIIFKVVSFAWAGFGATFGPLMLFSLFWKRVTREGAIAGMLGGGGMVFLWFFLLKPIGGVFGIYELLPAFISSCILIVAVSRATKEPEQAILDEFELARNPATVVE